MHQLPTRNSAFFVCDNSQFANFILREIDGTSYLTYQKTSSYLSDCVKDRSMNTVKATDNKIFFDSRLQNNSFTKLLAQAPLVQTPLIDSKPPYTGPVGISELVGIIQNSVASIEKDWQIPGKMRATTAAKLVAPWNVANYSTVEAKQEGYDIISLASAIFFAKNIKRNQDGSCMSGKYNNDVNNCNQFSGDFILDEEECRASGLFDFSQYDKANYRQVESNGIKYAQEDSSPSKSGTVSDCGPGEVIKGNEMQPCRPESLSPVPGKSKQPPLSRQIKEFPSWRGRKFD
jgi:hypothetical protein